MKTNWGLLILTIVISLLSFKTLIRPGYFPMHDDMQAMRVLQMDKCVKDLQIPCRWVPDMGYGYGYPQFNFYSPLPYYVMEAFHLVGFGFLDSVKIGFILTFVLSGIGMYLFARKFWGEWGGALSALFFVYAPYRAVDVYVRGAVGEFWALSMLPFVFWSVLKIKENSKFSHIYFALSLSALFLSHNITTLISLPFIALFILIQLAEEYLKKRNTKNLYKNFISYFVSGLWGIGFAAFFLLPAFFEKSYVHIESLVGGYFDYRIHFVNFRRLLFDQFWGFGGSEYGPHDEIFLGVGLLHWIVPSVSLPFVLFFKEKSKKVVTIFFFLVALLSLFMVHSRSSFIWESISFLSIMQFPWRFLVLTTFAFSFLAGAIVYISKYNKILFLILASLLLLINLSFFRTKSWIDITDSEKFSGENWRLAQTISIFDYLPIYSDLPPAQRAPEEPQILEGESIISSFEKKSNSQEFDIEVKEKSVVQLPLFYFPGMNLYVDGHKYGFNYHNELGLITFDIAPGSYKVLAKLEDTSVRTVGNILTLVSLLSVVAFILRLRKDNSSL